MTKIYLQEIFFWISECKDNERFTNKKTPQNGQLRSFQCKKFTCISFYTDNQTLNPTH